MDLATIIVVEAAATAVAADIVRAIAFSMQVETRAHFGTWLAQLRQELVGLL